MAPTVTTPPWSFPLPHGYPDSDGGEGKDVRTPLQPTGEGHASSEAYGRHFSEEEGASEEFDKSFRPKKQPAKQVDCSLAMKSPRRSNDDGPEDETPAKKPRTSIFGGPFYSLGSSHGEHGCGHDEERALQSPRHGIRQRMSSLSLTQGGSASLQEATELGSLTHLQGELRGNDPEKMSPVLSERSSIFPEYGGISSDDINAYTLRGNVNRNPTTTWVDLDASGDFDPDAESKEKQEKARKAKEKREERQRKAELEKIQEQLRNSRWKKIVRLHFKAFGTVLNITEDQTNEHWPDDWSELNPEAERARLEAVEEGRLREIEEKRLADMKHRPSHAIGPQTPIVDPLGLCDDLTGHPTARGCKECRVQERPCSMIENGVWPCKTCTGDAIDCHPIIEPAAKQKCKRCKELGERQSCSFETSMPGDEPHGICDQCFQDNEMDCTADPPEGYKAPRIDLTDIMYGPDRPHTACLNCRANGKRCSLKKKEDSPPCKNCKRNGVGCTFYDLPLNNQVVKKRGRKPKAAEPEKESPKRNADIVEGVSRPNRDLFTAQDLADLDISDDEIASREPTPEIQGMEDAEGHRGVLTTLWTSFPHPIRFSTGTNIDAPADCSFCEIPTFGLVGLFEKKVHVLAWYNGLGYSEIAGGHRENNSATTMCPDCTLGRLQIIVCQGHDVQPICSLGILDKLDTDAATNDLMYSEPCSEGLRAQLQRWCSLCFSLATFKCSNSQPSLSADDADEYFLDGCGLKLCDKCETVLREEFGSDCAAMVVALDKKPKARLSESEHSEEVQTIRADVGLLKKDGLLTNNVTLLLGDGEGNDSGEGEGGEVGMAGLTGNENEFLGYQDL